MIAVGVVAALLATAGAGAAVRNAYPAWSPDGKRIAFQSNRSGDFEIYTMKVDGSDVVRLTENDGLDLHPSWSPDGRKIVFAAVRNSTMYNRPGTLDVYVMDADGANPVRLTDNRVNDFAPVWSPDGRWIAFLSDRDGMPEVYVMAPDGRRQTSVTGAAPRGRLERGNPHWLGASRVVYDADDAKGDYHIYSLTTEGEALEQLTHTTSDVFFPAPSPDGKTLAYGQKLDDDWEILLVPADGGDAVNLTRSPGMDFWPSWSPDGRRLVFASKRDGDFDLYVVNRDGSGLERLTRGAEPGS